MASKSALDKLQETVVGTVRGVAKDPVGTARGALALGRSVAEKVAEGVAGQVTRTVRSRLGGGTPRPPSAPAPVRTPEPEPEMRAAPKPTDVARVAAKKAPAKKAPARKAPAKRSTPSGKLPPQKKAD
ncbi:hypothetical protein GCM10027062_38930 [Nocardioides hungaricus]